jgi:tetratricopeptide (TPR) repeat protein
MDQPAKALEMSERAIKYDTSNFYPFTHIVRATALNSLGRYEEALEAADVYLKREKNPGEALIVKAEALENLGRLDDALTVYDKAARSTDANSLHLQLSKGLLLCAAGKTAEGLSEFEKFLPKAPAAKDTRIVEIGKLQALMLEKSHHYAARGDAQKSENLRRAAEGLN